MGRGLQEKTSFSKTPPCSSVWIPPHSSSSGFAHCFPLSPAPLKFPSPTHPPHPPFLIPPPPPLPPPLSFLISLPPASLSSKLRPGLVPSLAQVAHPAGFSASRLLQLPGSSSLTPLVAAPHSRPPPVSWACCLLAKNSTDTHTIKSPPEKQKRVLPALFFLLRAGTTSARQGRGGARLGQENARWFLLFFSLGMSPLLDE